MASQQRAPTTPNQLHPAKVPGNFSRNLAAPGSWAGMRDTSMAGDSVHFRSSKVQSIAVEIAELENRFQYLAGRNKWLAARLLREKQSSIDSFMWSSEATRKGVFFKTWKDMMQELRLEKALSLQTDALRRCQESADSLGQVLSQEQSARRSAEAQSRRTLQELQQVQDSAAGLQTNVEANDRRIWQLMQQLEQAEGLISSGRQAAKAVLEQMAAHENKMTTLSDTAKPSISEDAMRNSRKVRNDFKDTLQQVSGLLAPKESSPDSKTQAVRWQTQRGEYSPSRFPASPPGSQKLHAEGPQQEKKQHQLQLERQMQQLEQQRKEREMDRQRMEQEQSIQQAQRDKSMQEQQQQQLQRMHEERMQANLQQQQMIQQVEQDRLKAQARREAEGRASSSASRFQHGEDGAAAPGSRRAQQSLSPMGRKQGERKMMITTGPAVMRGASGKISPISPTGAARPASLAEPWWYGQ